MKHRALQMIRGAVRYRPGVVMARFGWATINQIAKMLIQFAGIAMLSRLLSVSDFGVLAMAQLFTFFAALLQDMGTSAAIIQRKEINQELVSTVFWQNAIVGLALLMIMAAISPVAAILLHEPRLQSVLLVLSFVFPLNSSSTMQQAILQREGRLRDIARIEITTALLGLGAGVAAAIAGMGVFSLVIQQLVAASLRTLQLWLSTHWFPRFEWSKEEFKRTWGFTSHLLAFSTINYFARNADNMLIGRFLGAMDLAIYSMAYRLLITPVQAVGAVTSRVLLPIYSQMQDRPKDIGVHFVRTLSIINFFASPVMAFLWALREPFVAVFLGPKWTHVVDIVAWLAPVGYLQVMNTNVGFVVISLGRTKMVRNMGVSSAVTFIAFFFACVPFGIVAVAAGYFVANLAVCAVQLHITLRLVHKSLFSLLRATWKQFLLCMIAAATVRVLSTLDYIQSVHPIVTLVALGALGVGVYAALVAIFARGEVKAFMAARGAGATDQPTSPE